MKIVRYPHPALRHPGKPLANIDKRLRCQVGEMFELMYEHQGVGLAATQVALPFQLLVMNITGDPNQKEKEQVFLNPVIVKRRGAIDEKEGCLSFPTLSAKVRRAKHITVQAYNLNGEKVEVTASDLQARAWQHEIDHLNGVLFIDKFSPVIKLALQGEIRGLEGSFRKAQQLGDIPADVELERLLHDLEIEMTRP